MRLTSINTPAEGNFFLEEIFIPNFNKKFSVIPAKEGSVHKLLTNDERRKINHIFSTQTTRKVNNDFTIQFKNKWYQLSEIQPTTIRPRETVLVGEWLDNTLHFSLKNYDLNYIILPCKPKKVIKQPVALTTHKLNWKPPANHPWRTIRG